MSFSFWGKSDYPSIDLYLQPGGFLLLLLYVALFAWLFWHERDRLRLLRGGQVAVWLSCIILALILGHLPVLRLGGATGQPGQVSLALLAGLPLILAGGVGVLAAAVTGFAAGLIQSIWVSHHIFGAFEMALWGAVTAALIRQNYSGRAARVARFPVVASLLGSLVMWVAYWLSCMAYRNGNVLSTVLLSTSSLLNGLPWVLLDACLMGLIAHILFLALPAMVPTRETARTIAYVRSLKAELLVVFIPVIFIIILGLFSAVNITAVKVARNQSISQAARDTDNAAQRIPFMVQTGQGLLAQLAEDSAIWNEAGDLRQQRLQRSIRTTGFFKEIILLDRSLNPIDAYPQTRPGDQIVLEPEERRLATRVVDSSAPQTSSVYRRLDSHFTLSFLAPMIRAGDPIAGVIIGRADTIQAPMIRDIQKALQQTMDTGVGFVVDERGTIIVHPDPAMILTSWTPNAQPEHMLSSTPAGAAFMETAADGSQWLVYYRTVAGASWKTVIKIPYETILNLAATISTPFTIILLFVGLIACALIPLLSARLTRPLEALSAAAALIAQGQVDVPVSVSGESEVGRLGAAFESMRVRLQKRLKELALLLNISRAVSANPNLERNLEPILAGALQATPAICARIILVSPVDSQPEREIAVQRSGRPVWRKVRGLSGPVLRLVQGRRSVKVRDTSVYPGCFSTTAASAFGVPLLMKNRLVGVLLAEYKTPEDFEPSELEFLTTLAGQAAVVIESSRLFEAVESERQRLSAILTSASDAIVGSDGAGAVLLINPAARQALGLNDTDVVGRPVADLGLQSELVDQLLSTSPEPQQPQEFTLPNKRTLAAIVSPVVNAEGDVLGRVAVMRDITHLKEIDAMKSDFVQSASHDLRGPLQVMNGYASIMLAEGGLTPQQQDWVDKIKLGINQMTELITALLDITKIEAGIDVNMVDISVHDIVQDVLMTLRGRALEKSLDLSAAVDRSLPLIHADPMLLRQAVANLVENAIKYTPAGFVRLRVDQHDGELIVSVQDSGLGIAPEAQGRLFEKFYRVKNRDTAKIFGTGLGLAFVKSIAELHHGRVWVKSEPHQGSTFYLALPLSN
jgi:PAS domain S-box-containing protein